MNPLLKPLITGNPSQNPMLESLANTIKFARSFQSPQAFMAALQRENPNMYQYLTQLSKQLSNPMQAAAQMLQQQGISPQGLMDLLQR